MNTEPLRLLQISDAHLGARADHRSNGVVTEPLLAGMLEHLRDHERSADLVLATGDLSDDGSVGSYRRLAHLLGGLNQPVRCLPGNHDHGPTLRRHLELAPQLSCAPVWVRDPWQVVLLDSSVAGTAGGRLEADALADLARALAARPRHHTVIALHHPPLPTGSPWLDASALGNPDDLFAVVDAHPRVRAVIWGHVHQAMAAERRGVRLLGCPATCYQFAPGSAVMTLDDRPPGYRRLVLHPDGGVDTEVVRLAAAWP